MAAREAGGNCHTDMSYASSGEGARGVVVMGEEREGVGNASGRPGAEGGQAARETRRERLAAAMRANLRRRKQQQRAREVREGENGEG